MKQGAGLVSGSDVVADPADLKQLTVDLMVNCQRFTRLATRRSGTKVPHGLLRVLAHLDQMGSVGLSRLAEMDRCSQPTMTQLVNRLEQRGWVSRGSHATDARVVVVTMTAEGRAVLDEGRERAAEGLLPELQRLSAKDRRLLSDGLRILQNLVNASAIE